MKHTYLLATDLDDTLVGNQHAHIQLFNYFREQSIDLTLIYLTGRHFDSVKRLIIEEQLPIPDILVCDVGCSIFLKHKPNLFKEDSEWHNKIYADWPKDEILNVISELNLELQKDIPLNKRVSLSITTEDQVKDLYKTLTQKNLPVKTIYSSKKDFDILPVGSGKGNALLYILSEYYQDIQNVLVAGNSENDLEMLCLGYPSIVVGNAEKNLLNMQATPLLYKAKNNYANGIKEGFKYFYDNKIR